MSIRVATKTFDVDFVDFPSPIFPDFKQFDLPQRKSINPARRKKLRSPIKQKEIEIKHF